MPPEERIDYVSINHASGRAVLWVTVTGTMDDPGMILECGVNNDTDRVVEVNITRQGSQASHIAQQEIPPRTAVDTGILPAGTRHPAEELEVSMSLTTRTNGLNWA